MKRKMSKLISLVLAVFMLLSVVSITAGAATLAEGKCGENLTWTLANNGTFTISGTGAMYDWDYLDRAPWYRYCYSVRKVVVEAGVTTIGDYAFEAFAALKGIVLPEGITKIGSSAFSNCIGLKSIVLPESLTTIDDYAFHACEDLESIYIPISVTSTSYSIFNRCSALADVYYGGSEAQWNEICKVTDDGYENITNAVIHYNSTYQKHDCNVSGHKYVDGICSECGANSTWILDSKDAVVNGDNILMMNNVTAAALLYQASEDSVILDKNENRISDDSLVGTGMTLVLSDGTKKEIVVFGDVDGNGKLTSSDARLALRASVQLENYAEGSCYYQASNIDKVNAKITAADARLILRASVELENPEDWMI